jgi:hypothetical protein
VRGISSRGVSSIMSLSWSRGLTSWSRGSEPLPYGVSERWKSFGLLCCVDSGRGSLCTLFEYPLVVGKIYVCLPLGNVCAGSAYTSLVVVGEEFVDSTGVCCRFGDSTKVDSVLVGETVCSGSCCWGLK